MNLRASVFCILAAVSSLAMPPAAFAGCDARSGPNTAALVELYTSEGCSSCPPADRQLSRLPQALDPADVVIPLALHVNYWDYIGWKDPYAQAAFGARQSWLVHVNKERTVYTPQFFVGGAELRSWRNGLRERVRQLNAMPAAATIRVRGRMAAGDTLALEAEATQGAQARPAALYLALAESGLASSVTRGENSGATLQHDHVVRAWIGPIRVVAGKARVQREIALPAAWNSARLEVVAFVQDQRTGDVLQAVRAQQCAGS